MLPAIAVSIDKRRTTSTATGSTRADIRRFLTIGIGDEDGIRIKDSA
jgi:hypothetical protein